MTRPLLTPDEVADYLRVHPRTLANWRYTGTGPAYVKAGGVVRYRAGDVDEWLDEERPPKGALRTLDAGKRVRHEL